MRILITGAAGFIGFHVSRSLLDRGHQVTGVDNLNDYYDVRLKLARLEQLTRRNGFRFIKQDIADRTSMPGLFAEDRPERLSISPHKPACATLSIIPMIISTPISSASRISSEGCRRNQVQHLVSLQPAPSMGLQRLDALQRP